METPKNKRNVTVRCVFCATLNRVDASRARDRPACGECGKPILLDRPVVATDSDLERTIAESDVPVVVDFYADWCGPCKFMAPIFDEAARDRTGRILFTKLDTDRNPQMAMKFRIGGIPTLIVFSGGKEVERKVGAARKPELNEILDRADPAGP